MSDFQDTRAASAAPTVPTQELLRGFEIFAGLGNEALEWIAANLESIELTEGQTLIMQGDDGEAMFLLVSGELRVVVERPDASALEVGTILPGKPVGEMQFLVGGRRSASVVAARPSLVLALGRSVVVGLSDRAPEVIAAITPYVHRRLLRSQLAPAIQGIMGPLDAAALGELESRVEWVTLKQGETLFRQGDPADGWYIVVSGLLKILRTDEEGQEHVLGELGRGEGVGEMALFTGEPRSATPLALRDTELVRLRPEAFEDVMLRRPNVLMSITRSLIHRLETSSTRRSRKSQILCVVPASPSAPVSEIASALVAELAEAGSTLHVTSEQLGELVGIENAAELPADHFHWSRFSLWLDDETARRRFIVLEASERPGGWTQRAIRQADHIVVVADATGDRKPGEVESALLPSRRQGHHGARRTLLLVHPAGTRLPSNTRQWLAERDVDAHYHLRSGHAEDRRRVARLLSGRGVGLVLSGGGARGFAHLGVVRALRERGIPIDMVGGTSAGALLAGMLALDVSEEEVLDLNRRFIAMKPFSDYTVPVVSVLKSNRLDRSAKMVFGETLIEDLWLSYFACSTNLTTGESVVHDAGDLWKVARSTGSLPGVALPVVWGTDLMVDGGVLNNLPADVMRERTPGTVIAVNVSPIKDFSLSAGELPRSQLRYLLSRLLGRQKDPAPTIVDLMMRTMVLTSARRAESVKKDADLYLQVPTERFRMLEFERMEEILEVGYRHAVEAIGDWRPNLS